jgi:hypothetical protein
MELNTQLKPGTKRDTVGKIVTDLRKKTPDSRNPVEIMQEQLTDYEKNIFETIEKGRALYGDDFYIVVINKKERLLEGVYRNFFLHRKSCPTPVWDQIVYKYTYLPEILEFLWVIPAKDVCEYLKEHALEIVGSERELLNYVAQFYTGHLDRIAKRLNNEQDDSPLLEKKDLKLYA